MLIDLLLLDLLLIDLLLLDLLLIDLLLLDLLLLDLLLLDLLLSSAAAEVDADGSESIVVLCLPPLSCSFEVHFHQADLVLEPLNALQLVTTQPEEPFSAADVTEDREV